MFIHINQPLIISFYLTRYLFFAELAMNSADPQFFAQRAREGVNWSGAWGLNVNQNFHFILELGHSKYILISNKQKLFPPFQGRYWSRPQLSLALDEPCWLWWATPTRAYSDARGSLFRLRLEQNCWRHEKNVWLCRRMYRILRWYSLGILISNLKYLVHVFKQSQILNPHKVTQLYPTGYIRFQSSSSGCWAQAGYVGHHSSFQTHQKRSQLLSI